MEKETGKWVVSLHDISKIFLRYPYGYSFFFATDKETVLTWITVRVHAKLFLMQERQLVLESTVVL